MTLDLIALSELPSKIDELARKIDEIQNSLKSKPPEKEWLTRREKALKENISISMVDKLVRKGVFQKKKIGRKALIKAFDEL